MEHADTQGTLEESMHPSAHGQRAVAACLRLVGAAAPGRSECAQDWFGNGDPNMMRIRPTS
ncbi:hypothetical protein ACFY7H_24975 [Streptomyces sp. NPDC012794]|uniref:hypothetical protein n=1 Tax=Streptomyces sp. NPDC012794 TaxID=3364850 RepID=UPI0036919E36